MRARRLVHLVHVTDSAVSSAWQSKVITLNFKQRAEWDLSQWVHMYETETLRSESSASYVYPEVHLTPCAWCLPNMAGQHPSYGRCT